MTRSLRHRSLEKCLRTNFHFRISDQSQGRMAVLLQVGQQGALNPRAKGSKRSLSSAYINEPYLSIQVTSCLGAGSNLEHVRYAIRVRSLARDHFVYKYYHEFQRLWDELAGILQDSSVQLPTSTFTWLATAMSSFTNGGAALLHGKPASRIARLNIFLQRMVRRIKDHPEEFRGRCVVGTKIIALLSEFLQLQKYKSSLLKSKPPLGKSPSGFPSGLPSGLQPIAEDKAIFSMSLPETSLLRPVNPKRCRSRVFTEVDFKALDQ